MPKLCAASKVRRTASAPARWPARRGSPRAVAQRPFPSMMMPTWSPDLWLRKELCIVKFGLKKILCACLLALPHGADECFHIVQVALQRLPPLPCEPVFGARHAAIKVLGTGDVACLFQLARVDAQIAVGCLEQLFQIVKCERLINRQCAQNAEPHPFMDQAIEFADGGSLRLSTSASATACLRAQVAPPLRL